MARCQVATEAWGYIVDDHGHPVSGALCSIDTTVYVAATGGSTIAPASWISNSEGYLPGFIDSGTYTFTDSDGDDLQVDPTSGSESTGALDTRLDALESGYFNVLTYGAVGDGATDDTAAIQAADTAAGATGTVLIPPATYKTTDSVTFTGALKAKGAQLNYTGTDNKAAIILSGLSDTPGQDGTELHLPRVLNTNKSGTGWSGTAIGVEVRDVSTCVITVPYIRNFRTGLKLVGAAAKGCAYNTFRIGSLQNNKVNQLIQPVTTTAWVNQNLHIGGQYEIDQAETRSGTRQIEIVNQTGGLQPNNNGWLQPSMESLTAEYLLIGDCADSFWLNPRVEGTGVFGYHKIKFDGVDASRPAQGNRFEAGFDSRNLVVEAGVTPGTTEKLNTVVTLDGERRMGAPSWAGANATSDNGGVFVAMSRAGLAAMNTTALPNTQTEGSLGNFGAVVGGLFARFKFSTSTYSQILIDAANGTISFGSGSAAVDIVLSRALANVLKVGADDCFRTGLNTTANRPSAATVGQGSQFYDTTLHIPIWSDGTNWRDAAGNVV